MPRKPTTKPATPKADIKTKLDAELASTGAALPEPTVKPGVTVGTPSKAAQARALTGRQHVGDIEPLRSALLIAKFGADRATSTNIQRVYWPKSVYPTLKAAGEALQAAGLKATLEFTQYCDHPFDSLVEIIAAKTGLTPEHKADLSEHAAKETAPKVAKTTIPAGPPNFKTADARAITGPQSPSTFHKAARNIMNVGVAADGTAYYAVKGDWLKADTSHLAQTRWDRHEVILPLDTAAQVSPERVADKPPVKTPAARKPRRSPAKAASDSGEFNPVPDGLKATVVSTGRKGTKAGK